MHNLAVHFCCGYYCDKMNEKLLATVMVCMVSFWTFAYTKFIKSSFCGKALAVYLKYTTHLLCYACAVKYRGLRPRTGYVQIDAFEKIMF